MANALQLFGISITAFVSLTGGGSTSTKYACASGRYRNAINEGIQWSVTLPGLQPVDSFVPNNGYGAGCYFVINAIDQFGNPFASPRLSLVRGRTKEGVKIGKQTVLTGIDQVTYSLSREATDFPTFVNQAASSTIDTLATEYNVTDITATNTISNQFTLGLSGVVATLSLPVTPNYPTAGSPLNGPTGLITYIIPTYDAHGGTNLQHIAEIIKAVGYEYRVTANPAGNDYIDIFPVTYSEAMPRGAPVGQISSIPMGNFTGTYERGPDMSKAVTQFTFCSLRKFQSSQDFPLDKSGEAGPLMLNNPLNGPQAFDASTVGQVDWAVFFDAHGQVCGVRILHVGSTYEGLVPNYFSPVTSDQPAVSVYVTVFPPPSNPTQTTGLTARLRVSGTLPTTGIDNFWILKYPTIDLSPDPRPLRTPVRSALVPTLVVAQEAAPLVLLTLQKAWTPATVTSGDPLFGCVPAQQFQWNNYGTARIESVEVVWGGGKLASTLQLWEVPSTYF